MPQPPNLREGLDRDIVVAPPPAGIPAVLLPVRIETRFDGTALQPELWVRIYPDQIAIDTHDPRFTSAEVRSTQLYWDALWRAGTTDAEAARQAFEALARRYGAPRAAFLAQSPELAPDNPDERPTAPTPAGTPLPVDPAFAPLSPDLERPASWARAPLAVGLPAHWTVVLQRAGAPDRVAHGTVIPDGLAAGPDPQSPANPTPDGLGVDDGMRWMVDFDAAVAVGMALRIPLEPGDVADGFDRVLVFGLRSTTANESGPDVVAKLFEAHRFTDGLDLVPQGTPTNNTTDAAAGYSRSDPGYAAAYAASIEAAPPAADHDGPLIEHFLGLPDGALDKLEHAAQPDGLSSRHMLTALWQGTLGYFLDQFFSELLSDDAREAARQWVLDHVRPRGALAAFRVGDTPYGIVPMAALTGLGARSRSGVAREVADLVRRLWPHWRAGGDAVPHVTRDGDPDDDLMAILGMDASSREFRARYALGEEFLWYTMAWFGIGRGREDFVRQPGTDALTSLGHADWDPRLVHLAMAAHDRGVPFPTVDDAPVSEAHGLPDVQLPDGTTGNYISWLARAPLADIRDDVHRFPGGTPPSALLYKVLRHCVLLEWGRLGFRVLIDAELIDATSVREREFVHFPSAEPPARAAELAAPSPERRPTVWEALDSPAPGTADPRFTVADHLRDELAAGSGFVFRLHDITASLEYLAGLSTAELERLFTETLDTLSYRLDPWITALIVQTLEERGREGKADYHVGSFGWVEDLRAKDQPPTINEGPLLTKVERVDALRRKRAPDAPPPRPVREPAEDNAGFIHAPSLAQATTGAVLRNGYLTHRDPSDGQRLAVDFSSARVRDALAVLDGVREGQPLGALLGYRFERGMHRLHRDVLVQPLRDRFPLYANRLTEPSGPTEAVAANNVVNGLDVHRIWRDGSLFTGDPAMDAGQQSDVESLMADLDDVLDAIADLSLTESVFQLVRGNPAAAGGLLDAISRGERPPEPEVVRTPRGSVDLTNRLVLLLSPGVARAPAWGGAASPRAVSEPRLDAWVSTVLPDPGSVRCAVTYTEGGSPHTTHMTLAQLGLAPLDALELAAAVEHPAQSELEQRLHYRAARSHPAGSDFAIAFAPDASSTPGDRTFPEFLELARAVRDLLAGARALAPQDLLETERIAAAVGGTIDNTDLSTRAADAMMQLQTDLTALQAATTADDLRAALLEGSLYGGVGAIPVEPVASDAAATASLGDQRTSVARELGRRLTQAQNDDAAFDRTHATPERLRDHLVALLQTVFGRGFTVLPRFTAPAAADFDAALDAAGLLAGDADAPERWLAQLVPIRAGVWRYDALRTLRALVSGDRPEDLHVAQLPHSAGERWLALPFDPATPPPSHRVGIVADVLPGFDPTASQCGLVLDEWIERIPVQTQSTGLAFHYDQPTARAPQAVVFALAPEGAETWDDAALATVLSDTLSLARARGVDLEMLPALGQLLPTLFFPFNVGGETVSLDYYDIR